MSALEAKLRAAIEANELLRFTRFEGGYPGADWINAQHAIVKAALEEGLDAALLEDGNAWYSQAQLDSMKEAEALEDWDDGNFQYARNLAAAITPAPVQS